MLTFEEFVYQAEWLDVVRLANYVSERDTQCAILKKIREFKRGRPLFDGPYGDQSEWAGMCRNWYKYYLTENAKC